MNNGNNAGYYNTGVCNTGDCNTGYCNAGDYNAGNRNAGNHNAGNCNSGDYNAGHRNIGNCNAGDWNAGDWNTGCFCTTTPKVSFFDEETNIGYEELWTIEGIQVLSNAPYETNKELSQEELKEKRQKWYNKLCEKDKQAILDLPNFNAEKFEKCTLIDVKENDNKIKNKIAELEEEIKKLKEMVKE